MPKGLDTSSKNLNSRLFVVHNILQCHKKSVKIYNSYSTLIEIKINH